jgi:hypothetical protein
MQTHYSMQIMETFYLRVAVFPAENYASRCSAEFGNDRTFYSDKFFFQHKLGNLKCEERVVNSEGEYVMFSVSHTFKGHVSA